MSFHRTCFASAILETSFLDTPLIRGWMAIASALAISHKRGSMPSSCTGSPLRTRTPKLQGACHAPLLSRFVEAPTAMEFVQGGTYFLQRLRGSLPAPCSTDMRDCKKGKTERQKHHRKGRRKQDSRKRVMPQKEPGEKDGGNRMEKA